MKELHSSVNTAERRADTAQQQERGEQGPQVGHRVDHRGGHRGGHRVGHSPRVGHRVGHSPRKLGGGHGSQVKELHSISVHSGIATNVIVIHFIFCDPCNVF